MYSRTKLSMISRNSKVTKKVLNEKDFNPEEMILTKVGSVHGNAIYEIMKHNKEAQSFIRPLRYWQEFANYASKHENDLSWVAGVNNEIIGFIYYTKKLYSRFLLKNYDEDNSLVLSIYIHPDFIGKKCGKTIFLKSLSLIPPEIETIYASTYQTNIHAQIFFEKLNFKKVGEGKSGYNPKDTREIVIYELKIPKKD